MPRDPLDQILRPGSVALVGASEREGSVGASLTLNLLKQFEGKTYPVNPQHAQVMEADCFPSVEDLPETPDLAVIATPAKTVIHIIDACGRKGIKAVIIISAGFGESGSEGKETQRQLEARRQEHGMRIVGPNCLGLIRPGRSLNLTFLRKAPRKGGIAFLSQSGAMGSAILDWASEAGVGFSAFVSVGNMMDVDFGDLITYFGNDEETTSIIMYMESVTDAGNFLRAARSVAPHKPLLVLKAGKHERSAQAVASHTGSLAGEDEVYDAAFRRAGVTRVENAADLYICTEMLAKQPLPSGPRLCVITNAGGPGILAADAVLDRNGTLAELSDQTCRALAELLPGHAGTGNPVDVLGDANAERFRDTALCCARDQGVDGLLVVYSPQGEAGAEEAAGAVIEVARQVKKPVVTSWMGGEEVAGARRLLLAKEVPTMRTPEDAVRAYLLLHRYARNRELLQETPEELSPDTVPNRGELSGVLRRAIGEEREALTEGEAQRFLAAYGLPAVESKAADDPDQAAGQAERLGFPVVLKVRSPDVSHKSDVGGVLLGLKTADDVREGFECIRQRMKKQDGSLRFDGVTVQKMVEDVAYELILGARRDPAFGMVMLFGRGGTGVELYGDTAVGIPPLNRILARRLMEETRVYLLLQGYRNAPPADVEQLEEHLVRFSRLVTDFPEIREIDVNPLAVRQGRFIALDCRMIVERRNTDQPS